MLPSKIHDHNNGLDYMLVGDYYLPDFMPFEASRLGKYGRMRLCYLKEHRPCTYTALLLSGKLYDDLHDADETAQRKFKIRYRKQAKHLLRLFAYSAVFCRFIAYARHASASGIK